MTAPQTGHADPIAPGLRRILAPNPSPMTHWGTNTYLLGRGQIAVIDPGPANPDHLQAILNALLPDEEITHIFVTHPHLDHSPLARPLAAATGAPIHGFGPPAAGRTAVMHHLAAQGIGGGEGVDHDFHPDVTLSDGEEVRTADWHLRALHTPGHFAGHLCLAWGDRLFSGDHVMGWASSLISPPDGDMGQYVAALHRLAATPWAQFYPGHGAAIPDPAARLAALIAHRQMRETAVLDALARGAAYLHALTTLVYTDTPQSLLPAARRNLLAHLVDLTQRNLVHAQPDLSPDAQFSLI